MPGHVTNVLYMGYTTVLSLIGQQIVYADGYDGRQAGSTNIRQP